jgi:hypothetical protein
MDLSLPKEERFAKGICFNSGRNCEAINVNARHGAALALAGWYLMMPPISGRTVDPNAPLATWHVFQSFDSVKECERVHGYIKDHYGGKKLYASAAVLASCIDSCDRRLKPK